MDDYQNSIIVQTVELTSALNYAYFAVFAFLSYDTVLLFNEELKYFLRPPKKALSYLYFVTRYSGILITILQVISNTSKSTTKTCDLTYALNILQPLLILCIDCILLLRVRALYAKGKVITVTLFVAFAIEAISGLAIAIQTTIAVEPQPTNLAPGITFCLENSPSLAENVVSWAIPLAYGFLLMLLAVYKSATILKELEDPSLSTVRIVKIIIRDQVIYFMSLILVSASAILENFFLISIPVFVVEGSLGNPVILSSVGARLLLNMKEAGEKGLNEGMGTGLSGGLKTTASGMKFATPPVQTIEAEDGGEIMTTNEIGMPTVEV